MENKEFNKHGSEMRVSPRAHTTEKIGQRYENDRGDITIKITSISRNPLYLEGVIVKTKCNYKKGYHSSTWARDSFHLCRSAVYKLIKKLKRNVIKKQK